MDSKEERHRDIKLSEEQFKEFHEQFGSNNFKLQGELLTDLGNKKIDLYFKSIGFTTSTTNVLGIVAGFGFTAFGYVQSVPLFFTGESLLVAALFYGLIWTQRIYTGEFNTINADFKKFEGYFENRNGKFLKIFNRALKERTIGEEEFTELNKVDNDSINLFKTEEGGEKVPQTYSKVTYFLGIVGTVLFFSSFFILDILAV